MRRHYAALIAAVAMSAGASMPVQADPPPWAPAHGQRAKQVREYQYMYYPAQQVYYSPQEHAWFWMSGGNWQVGVSLPTRYQVQANSGLSITLASERPYVQHVYVEEQYGRPWREKHKKEKKEKKEKHNKHRDD